MRRIIALVPFTAVALMLAGCGAQSGKTVMTQGANAEPVMGTAPQTGTYKLYTAFSPNATFTVNLKEGDSLGFRRTSNGQIEAVGGDETQVLPKGTSQAYWKLQK